MLPNRNALSRLAIVSMLLLLSLPASAQDDDNPDGGDEAEEADGNLPSTMRPPPQTPPQLAAPANSKVTIDFVDAPLSDVVKYFARITGRNFILTDDLKGDVTIISHKQVTIAEAYEAFLSALETSGYTTVTVGGMTKIVSHGEAGNNPLRVYENGNIPYTDNFVTQIIQLENVSVGDISSVVKDLGGKSAKVIAYAPTNTLIITDSAVNIRRVYRIISQLDVEAPRARMEIIPLEYATASEVEKIIEELYGSADSSSSSSTQSTTSSSASSRRNRRTRNKEPAAASAGATSTTVGAEGKYIQKIISDERTNSLILMANEEAMTAVRKLIAEIDVDVDITKNAQLHVIYLEHAKAEDVSLVLSNLSDSSSSSSSNNNRTNSARRTGAAGASSARGGRNQPAAAESESSGGATAAFDSGVRITSDENTNSLVIIATPDQMRILRSVVDKLDIVRKQVFVEAVIMELASEDSSEVGIGVHLGSTDGAEDPTLALLSGQLGSSSLGLSQDLLTGMALGVFGPSISTTVDGVDVTVPAFGIVLNAIQSNSSTSILSTPNILTMDNEEAKIVVGRNIPFPVSNSFNANGQPVISYQREDVAITLKVTPQINESDYVTLQVFQEVQEVEEDSSGLDVTSAGFITSKRSAETTVVIRDNQTVVIGGLMGSTDTEVETKIPVLGDLPLLGRLFRGTRKVSRKTNLLIFLTPHVINEPADMEEIYRVKVAQRQEFLRRFYGKSREEQEAALQELLQYSMNQVDQPSLYRGPTSTDSVMIDTDDSMEESAEEIGATSPASTTPPRTPSDAALDRIEDGTDTTDTTDE
ncbi:MAG: general secretion pathway protein D [Myxococcota bacterium]|jgi:general secretion pathway protein D